MKINKKHIIISILMILTLIFVVFCAVNANATSTDTDVVDEKTIARIITALAKGYDSITAVNLQNVANHYLGSGVVTIGNPYNNRITITFIETGNSYDISANTGVAFDDVGGLNGYYTITYDANGGMEEPCKQTKIADTTIRLSTMKPIRTGYEFIGWSTNPSATTAEYQEGEIFTENANTTLYAIWGKEYTVTFNGNNGKIKESESDSYTTSLTYTLTTNKSTIPTLITDRPGYRFVGWSTNSMSHSVAYGAGDIFKGTSDMILYAIWEEGELEIM